MKLTMGHVPEPTLAALADDPLTATGLTASSRLHLETCDRCQRLAAAHARAGSLLRSEWRLVAASELATATVPTAVESKTRTGTVFGRPSAGQRPFATVAVGLALVIVLAAGVLFVVARPSPLTSVSVV